MANEIGLAGLHRAKALCLVSLGETVVAPPSERGKEGKKEAGVRSWRGRGQGEGLGGRGMAG